MKCTCAYDLFRTSESSYARYSVSHREFIALSATGGYGRGGTFDEDITGLFQGTAQV